MRSSPDAICAQLTLVQSLMFAHKGSHIAALIFTHVTSSACSLLLVRIRSHCASHSSVRLPSTATSARYTRPPPIIALQVRIILCPPSLRLLTPPRSHRLARLARHYARHLSVARTQRPSGVHRRLGRRHAAIRARSRHAHAHHAALRRPPRTALRRWQSLGAARLVAQLNTLRCDAAHRGRVRGDRDSHRRSP